MPAYAGCSARYDRELAKGPARLATALDVALSLNGTDTCDGPDAPLTLLTGTPPDPDRIRTGPRTGVGGDGAPHPWRFWIHEDPTVSPYRAHTPGSGDLTPAHRTPNVARAAGYGPACSSTPQLPSTTEHDDPGRGLFRHAGIRIRLTQL